MAADDQRIRNGQGGYNCGVYVDPQNPDIVYTLNTSSYKSTDGGKTFTGFKGAPGGDDPQQMWIDPTNGSAFSSASTRARSSRSTAAATWSSWYNQSTEQIYHLSVDNSFPYWVYGTQQDAGAIRTRIRGNLGAITPLDWNPVSGWEWGTIIPDPLDPNTVYASGSGILKISYPSEQWINVSPAQDPSRKLRTTFYAADRVRAVEQAHAHRRLPVGVDDDRRRRALDAISPDLGVRRADAARRHRRARRRAARSSRSRRRRSARGTIWVGTNNGLIKVTRDGGKTWDDASIPESPERAARRSLASTRRTPIAAEAYAAVDLHRSATTRRTSSARTTTERRGRASPKASRRISRAEASRASCATIRSERGCSSPDTESGMYVSFDDGDHWQSLMLNLPNTSYRDIAIKDNDLVVATYGRGFWVLDDYLVLRQVTPAIASRARRICSSRATPCACGATSAPTRRSRPKCRTRSIPPTGVIIDYWLAQAPSGDITLDVLDCVGRLVRHMSSAAISRRSPRPRGRRIRTSGSRRRSRCRRTPARIARTGICATMRRARSSHSFEINANPGLTPASPRARSRRPARTRSSSRSTARATRRR